MTFLETQRGFELRCHYLQNFIEKAHYNRAYACLTREELLLIETTIEQLRAISEKIYGKSP